MNLLVNQTYRIDGVIGKGGCGIVCLGTDIRTNKRVAIKLENINEEIDLLKDEADMYRRLAGGIGIPRLHWFGRERDFRVLVIDLLGPDLQSLFNYCGRRFSLKTVLLLADQLITRIEHIHSKSLIHRDIKPHNFLMGFGAQGHLVYAVDFGMAEEYEPDEEGDYHDQQPFCGTTRYTSLASHLGYQVSPKDDLESLAYILVYFLRSFLPWNGLNLQLTGSMKLKLSPEEICKGVPEEFARHIRYVRCLSFNDKPNYEKLRRMYARLLEREGFENDGVFDWTVKMRNEDTGDDEEEPNLALREAVSRALKR